MFANYFLSGVEKMREFIVAVLIAAVSDTTCSNKKLHKHEDKSMRNGKPCELQGPARAEESYGSTTTSRPHAGERCRLAAERIELALEGSTKTS